MYFKILGLSFLKTQFYNTMIDPVNNWTDLDTCSYPMYYRLLTALCDLISGSWTQNAGFG